MKARTFLVVAVFLFLCALFAIGPFNYSQYDNTGAEVEQSRIQGLRSHSSVDTAVDTETLGIERVQSGVRYPDDNFSFNPNGRDALVFIHIPKTGGSAFLRHLVTLKGVDGPLCTDIITQPGKKDRVLCPRHKGVRTLNGSNPWLIAEKTLGWYCGLHPFYSEYKSCISLESKRTMSDRRFDPACRFHFSTMLRHPVLRYLSEYLHVQRGATFSYRHVCNEKRVKDKEMPPCYPGFYDREMWVNVTLSKFLSCDSNWANNRQTLSVADLEVVSCFNKHTLPPEEREKRLLQSAKDNLRKFAFFGITEYLVESSLLFENVFGVKFSGNLSQKPADKLHSAPMLNTLWNSASTYNRIAKANHLDMQLYEYAMELFTSRLKTIGVEIDPSRISNDIQKLPASRTAFSDKRFLKQNFDLDVE